MAFPTIPTTAGNTLLSSTTSPASTTHTFPSLTTLAPAAGDLIIAICVQYQGGTANAEFSSWGASLTEFLDDALGSGTGNGANGFAYKIASGSESGTFTVTSAHSFKSVNILMRIPAGTWHGTTPPEVTASNRVAGAAGDPASLSPSWGADDTLWIAVMGHTETSTTGSPPTISASPTNYSGDLIVARVADAVGEITAGVGFFQNNAVSEDAGVYTGSNLSRGNGIAAVIAVRPAVPVPTTTGTAQISLAPGITPDTRTSHVINMRARTTSGAGKMRAALYEGSTNITDTAPGYLESAALTTTLAPYALAIADADAAAIGSYSDLEIRIWGYAVGGGAIVFEVSELSLSIPTGTAAAIPRNAVINFQDPAVL